MIRRCLLALAFLPALSIGAAEPRPIAETDLYSFRWVADPRISPDGALVAYTLVRVNAKHDGYDTSLWVVSTAGGTPRPLTQGPRDSAPRWSPDGKRLAFLRSAGGEKPAPAQLWLLPWEGGEARQLTEMPKGAGAAVWSPDGRQLAFNSATWAKDFDKKKDEEESDVRVITRAVYRANGEGYSEPGRPSHIWVVDASSLPAEPRKAKSVTTGDFSAQDPVWSRDGTRLYFLSDRTLEPYYEAPKPVIYAVAAMGGEAVRIAGIDGPAHALSLSPDGTRLAFVGSVARGPNGVERSYSQPDLFVTSVEPGSTPKLLTSGYDFDIGGGIGGDQGAPRAGGASTPYWSADGRSIVVVSSDLGRANLHRVDAASGKVEPLSTGDQSISSYTATPDGGHVVALISTPTMIGDLYALEGSAQRRLTDVNSELFSTLRLSAPQMIWYESFDGKRIQAWVQCPPDFKPGTKYPLILNIHGGPHAAYGYVFDHEFQWMAAKGYVVLYPNPRGSTGYGQDFGNVIQYAYPGDDYKDLMAGVDELIRRGWVDAARMGVTGGSGGGVLTNWVVGHTDRFTAAVSQRSIADWRDFWYTADFALFTPTWFRGAPWREEADFKQRSPISYVENIRTPLMLIEGESDLRTPPAAGGEQMFRALKYLRRPVAMVRFPGESHELSRSGKPTHRVERLRHIVAWMDQYVLGKETHTYDVR